MRAEIVVRLNQAILDLKLGLQVDNQAWQRVQQADRDESAARLAKIESGKCLFC